MVKLRELRMDQCLSVPKLAELSGVSRRTIQEVENRGDCRMSTAYALCKALGCKLDDFWEEDE